MSETLAKRVVNRVSAEFRRVLEQLKADGLLLQNDSKLPSVCTLVAGSPIKGSWWAHPRSHEIFRVNCELAESAGDTGLELQRGRKQTPTGQVFAVDLR